MKAVVVPDIFANPKAGNIQFSNGGAVVGMFICCPGCGVPRAVMFKSEFGPLLSKIWQWDGDLEKPTVTPSIEHPGCWHGWLTKGEFVAC